MGRRRFSIFQALQIRSIILYNIFTVLNSGYMSFAKVWINSLHENVDMQKVKTIYILDTGLIDSDIEYLEKFERVEIVISDINIQQTSNALPKNSLWLQHVLRKTKYFRKVLKMDDLPLVMIDSDCMFLSDFSEFIDTQEDVLVCNRSYHDHDNWIASFFVVNNKDNGLKFMKLWIDRMKKLMKDQPNRGWFESHSLNLCLKELKDSNENNLKVGDVFTHNVSCEEPSYFDHKNTKIIHFKGTDRKTDFSQRFRRFDSVIDVKQKIKDYIDG